MVFLLPLTPFLLVCVCVCVCVLHHGQAEAAVEGSGDDFEMPAGLELRLCPKCNARIEKNEG